MRTGSLSLDLLIDGYQPGTIYEFHGEESSGKTTLALLGVAACQFTHIPVLLCPEPIDVERAFLLGVDLENTLYTRSPFVEDLERIVASLPISTPSFIVIDSSSMLISRDENRSLYNGMEDTSWCVRHLLGPVRHHCVRTGSVAVVTSQVRAKPGFGLRTAAFKTLDQFCDYRIKTARADTYTQSVRLHVLRDPKHLPGQIVDVPLGPDGLDLALELLWLALGFGIAHRSGSWYYFQEHRLGQGREDAARTLYRNHLDLVEYLLLGDPA